MTASKPVGRPLPEGTTAWSENQRLATLLQISQALSSTLTLKTALHDVLDTLAREHRIERSLIALKTEEGPQLHPKPPLGLIRPGHHISYTVGEGIVGKVVESGKAAIVPRASKEPTLLFRATPRHEALAEEFSFICVPIAIDRRTVGALGVTLTFKPDRHYDRSAAA